MPNYKDEEDCFLNNLIDSGCNDELIKKCEMLKKNQQINELIKILIDHKQHLLEILHESTNQIDCLDYLICRIKKENHMI